ncbi:COG1470 family protein [Streptomyces cyaneofuscatus]|uniref:COG1470 family protein n=1 Tax=Streptomyces cyaneofuscatus TaxID=66883 RepID=UPI003415FA76
MGAIVLLLEDDTPAKPGEETRRPVQICNSGSVVDRFELDIVGDAKDWIRVEPAEVNAFPDQSVGAELIFTPPRSAKIPAGEVPFALRVMSHEDLEGSAVEEATVTVGAFTDFDVKLVPTTRRARFGARFHAVIDNRGNAPLRTQLYAIDPDTQLRFTLPYKEIEVARGKGAVAPVKVRPAARQWRGPEVTLPFQVLAVHQGQDGDEEHTADGVLIQAPVVPGGAVSFVMAVAAAVLALLALWFFVLRPSAESGASKGAPPDPTPGQQDSGPPAPGITPGADTATNAGAGGVPEDLPFPPPPVDGRTEGTSAGPDGTARQETTGGPKEEPGGPKEESGAPAGQEPGRRSSGESSQDDGGRAFDRRIQAEVAVSPEYDDKARYTVPDGSVLLISDVVFENVAGDTGVVQIQRGGEILRQVALETFRDYETHYREPMRFGPGEDVVLAVRCDVPGGQLSTGAGAAVCTPGAYFSGRLVPAEQ